MERLLISSLHKSFLKLPGSQTQGSPCFAHFFLFLLCEYCVSEIYVSCVSAHQRVLEVGSRRPRLIRIHFTSANMLFFLCSASKTVRGVVGGQVSWNARLVHRTNDLRGFTDVHWRVQFHDVRFPVAWPWECFAFLADHLFLAVFRFEFSKWFLMPYEVPYLILFCWAHLCHYPGHPLRAIWRVPFEGQIFDLFSLITNIREPVPSLFLRLYLLTD